MRNKRNVRFTFQCNKKERRQLKYIANRLRRTQSDAIRFLVAEAIEKFRQEDEGKSIVRLKEPLQRFATEGAPLSLDSLLVKEKPKSGQ